MIDLLKGLPEDLQAQFLEHLAIIKAAAKGEAKQRKAAKKAYEIERATVLANGSKYELVKVFREDAPGGRLNDFVEVSGWEWAIKLLKEYSQIGHSIGLYSLTLFVDGAKWKKIIFKY